MKFLIILLLNVSLACAQSSGDGLDGKAGTTGDSGRNGESGIVTFASGCEDFLLKSVEGMTNSFAANSWKEDREWMCSKRASLSSAEASQIHPVLDRKISSLLQTGFFKDQSFAPTIADKLSFSSVEEKIAFLESLYSKVERSDKVQLACRNGFFLDQNLTRYDVQVCQSLEAKLQPSGKIEFDIEIEAKDLDCNALPGNTTRFNKRITLSTLPERCENGLPMYRSKSQGKYVTGEEWTGTIDSKCNQYTEEFSAVYSSLTVTYE